MRINAVGGLRRTQTSNQTIDRLIDAGDTRLDHSPASDIGIAVPAEAVPHRGLFSSEIVHPNGGWATEADVPPKQRISHEPAEDLDAGDAGRRGLIRRPGRFSGTEPRLR